MSPKTLYDKIWDAHVVDEAEDGTCLLYIDRHLVHEVTSPQAFEGLRMTGRTVRAARHGSASGERGRLGRVPARSRSARLGARARPANAGGTHARGNFGLPGAEAQGAGRGWRARPTRGGAPKRLARRRRRRCARGEGDIPQTRKSPRAVPAAAGATEPTAPGRAQHDVRPARPASSSALISTHPAQTSAGGASRQTGQAPLPAAEPSRTRATAGRVRREQQTGGQPPYACCARGTCRRGRGCWPANKAWHAGPLPPQRRGRSRRRRGSAARPGH